MRDKVTAAKHARDCRESRSCYPTTLGYYLPLVFLLGWGASRRPFRFRYATARLRRAGRALECMIAPAPAFGIGAFDENDEFVSAQSSHERIAAGTCA
jgi:hypothetical protein